MIKRKLTKKLTAWKDQKDRKPLIIRGARQVGKTTLINQFGKQFAQYIYLNLETVEDRHIFSRATSIEDLIDAIFFFKEMKKDLPDTLIFIDEIQAEPLALNWLRYFYEKCPNCYVIAAGSLLETILDRKVTVPVGRVAFLGLKPLSFEEFLWAMNEESLLGLMDKIHFPDYAHEKAMRLFRRYMLIGGMPEVVSTYAQDGDLLSLGPIYESLILSYMEDIEKYADKQSIQVIRHVMTSSIRLAGCRIKFQNFGQSNYSSKEVKESFSILEKALVLNLIRPTTSFKLPVIPNFKKSPKVQFLDTGLVNAFVGLQKDLFQTRHIETIHDGLIAEHIVGQELLAMQDSLLYQLNFWIREKRQSNAEVDFIHNFRNWIIPIEVKAGAAGRLRSLHQFIDRADHPLAIRICSNKLSIEKAQTIAGKSFYLINIPFYLISRINQYLNYTVNEYNMDI